MNDVSLIVKVVAYILIVPVFIFGSYVILHGHLSPGGGFAGGAILATLVAMLVITFRDDFKENPHEIFSILECIGMIFFILLAFFGLSSSFFHNFLVNLNGLFGKPVHFGVNPGYLNTAGVIPLMNMAVGIEVFSALSLIVLMLSMRYGGERK
ncbi:MAG TPA: sodium:proton antiporter [Candidatus Aenigmarchaeota archaeon]|nr:MAG: sodium:proton antiporter [Candidatus Aenigmarchaeota archaeon]HDD46407.1 sodium:proton antiporter [Candidatus Aenigmarchaeota archaeon]